MTNYVKTTNFLRKDSLPDDSVEKIIRGSEFDTEFNNLVIAVASKANLISPILTGIPTAPTASAGSATTQIATTAFVDNVAGSLGTMSTQDSDTVAITGGTVSGITATFNLTGNASTATTATTANTANSATIATTANALNTNNNYRVKSLGVNRSPGSAGYIYANGVIGQYSGISGNVGATYWDAGYNPGGIGGTVAGSNFGQPGNWLVVNSDFVNARMSFYVRTS